MPSLYVHVPFCQSKCAYCAFYSVPLGSSDFIPQYLSGIKREIVLRMKEAPQGVSSLFLGGGTPTVLSAAELDGLLDAIHRNYTFLPKDAMKRDPEIKPFHQLLGNPLESPVEKTAEANPGTLTAEKLAVLHNYGINRISVGAQSFNDELLKRIGRIHTAEDIKTGVKLIRKAGIGNLNLDLIFGLPGQTMKDWQDTLKQALACFPDHLSLYVLTLEEDTPLGKKYLSQDDSTRLFPALPDDDLQADMYEWAVQHLALSGYCRYEISNFARPGFACQHNLTYWEGGEYFGIGPGAVSCLGGVRTRNKEDLTAYSEMIQSGKAAFDPEETEVLTKTQLMSEYLMLGLRKTEGIDLAFFAQKFSTEIQDIYGQILLNYIDRNLLILEGGWLRINPKYFFVANSILQIFV